MIRRTFRTHPQHLNRVPSPLAKSLTSWIRERKSISCLNGNGNWNCRREKLSEKGKNLSRLVEISINILRVRLVSLRSLSNSFLAPEIVGYLYVGSNSKTFLFLQVKRKLSIHYLVQRNIPMAQSKVHRNWDQHFLHSPPPPVSTKITTCCTHNNPYHVLPTVRNHPLNLRHRLSLGHQMLITVHWDQICHADLLQQQGPKGKVSTRHIVGVSVAPRGTANLPILRQAPTLYGLPNSRLRSGLPQPAAAVAAVAAAVAVEERRPEQPRSPREGGCAD